MSVDFTGGDGSDKYGHGTHVASTIAGAQGSAMDTRDYRGVASGARIINLRVLGADGSGMASSVIDAIDWAIENRARYNIRVINLSLGTPVLQPYRDDPLCEATERAVSAGIVVVAAAGNVGMTKDGRRVDRRHHLSGQRSERPDRRGARRACHKRSLRRHRGDLQLARAGDVRPDDEAGPGGAGEPRGGGGSARFVSGHGTSGSLRRRVGRGRLFSTLGNEHGVGGGERGCRAARR